MKTILWGYIKLEYYNWIKQALITNKWYITDPSKLVYIPCREVIFTEFKPHGKGTIAVEKKRIVIPSWWYEFEEIRKRDDNKEWEKKHASKNNFDGILAAANQLFDTISE